MATKIVTKNSSTASAVPTASDLVQGELAVNVADKRLFTEDNGGSIVELGTNPSGNVTFQDNGKAIFGAGSDLQIYHDGSNSRIVDAGTGYLKIQATDRVAIRSADDSTKLADFYTGGAVKLYYANAEKLATTSTGIDVTGGMNVGNITSTGDLSLSTDNATAYFGAGLDLRIYHDGSNSYIADTGTGGLRLLADADTAIRSADNSTPKAIFGGDVKLYHSGNQKLATTATGIDVTGTATMDGLNISNASGGNVAQFTNVSSADLNINLTSGVTLLTPSTGILAFGTSNTERMRIDSAGNVGIGTSSPSSFTGYTNVSIKGGFNGSNLDFHNSSGTRVSAIVSNPSADFTVETNTTIPLLFKTNSTERMRIDSAGNFLLGTTSAISLGKTSVLFDGTNQNAFIAKTTRSANGSAFAGFVNSSGTVIGSISQDSSSTVNYISSSDQRLKENITDSDDSGNVIDAIQVRKFNWIADGAHEKYGFIAQELKAVVPNAVSSMGMPDEEDPMLGVDPSKLVPMLIKEIQSLRNRVAQLEE